LGARAIFLLLVVLCLRSTLNGSSRPKNVAQSSSFPNLALLDEPDGGQGDADEANTIIVKRHGKLIRVPKRGNHQKAYDPMKQWNNVGIQFPGPPKAGQEREKEQELLTPAEMAEKMAEKRRKARLAEERKMREEDPLGTSEWFYNDQHGNRKKCLLKELPDRLKANSVNFDTYVYTHSAVFKKLSNWVRIREFPELQEYLEAKIFGQDLNRLEALAGLSPMKKNDTKKTLEEEVADVMGKISEDQYHMYALNSAGVSAVMIDMKAFNKTMRELKEIMADPVPATMIEQKKIVLESMKVLSNCTGCITKTMTDLATYMIEKDVDYVNETFVSERREHIDQLSRNCQIQMKRTYNTMRAYAFKENHIDIADSPSIHAKNPKKKQSEKTDPDRLIDKDDKKQFAAELEDLRQRKKQARGERNRTRIEKKARASAEKKLQLEAYLLKLPAMTLLQARRFLAGIMDYSSRYFERHTKDTLENFVRVELADGISVEKMRVILQDIGYPYTYLWGKNKEELTQMCHMNGISTEK